MTGNRDIHLVAGETRDGYRWVVLGVTSIGALLAALTSGTLVIALPEILRDLHTDLFTLLWIVVGYTLAATVLLLNAGRIADQVGRARTYTAGFALFTAASIACALAPSAFLLVIARLVQGVGGAFLMANSAALVTDAFPRRELGRALGINAMVVGAGLILGPILGGWLTGFGWQTVFWFNVPIGLIGTAAAATLLVEQGRRAPRAGLDLAGSALYLVGLTGLVTALAFGGIYGWTTGWVLAGFAAFIVADPRVPVGRGASPVAAPRPRPVPQPAVRARQPDRAAQRDRADRGAVPAGLLPPGRPRLRPGDRRADARAARARAARPVADQRRAGRPDRVALPGDARDARHRRRPGRADHDPGRHAVLAAGPVAARSSAPAPGCSSRPTRAP